MNWEAIGAVGEIVGAAAVVATLIILVFQIRDSTRATQESNRLERASALDRHSDSIGRWRGRLMENEDLMRIWHAAGKDEPLDAIARVRLSFVWIDFTNTQRANFVRARTVGAAGLARQAVLSVASEGRKSATMREEWGLNRIWHELESPEFVQLVDEAMAGLEAKTIAHMPVAGEIVGRGA